MRWFVERFPVSVYFVLACAVSWTFWVPLAMAAHGSGTIVIPYQHYFGAFGPILAALLMTAAISGRSGVKELGRAMLRWRVDARWYLFALLGPVLLYMAGAVGVGLSGGDWGAIAQFGRSDEFPGLGLIGVWLLQTLTFGIGEEAGWRGFALPRLQSRHNALSATLRLTLFWACWHIPVFFYRPGYAGMGPGEITGWFFSLLTGAILLTWLFNSSRGSILIVALFHGCIDVAFTSGTAGAAVMNTMGFLTVIWAITVLVATGPRDLSGHGRQQVHAAGPAREPAAASRHD